MKSFFSVFFGLTFLAFQAQAQLCLIDCLPSLNEPSQEQMAYAKDHSCCEDQVQHEDHHNTQPHSEHCNEVPCLSSALSSNPLTLILTSTSFSHADSQMALISQAFDVDLGAYQVDSSFWSSESFIRPTSDLGLYIILKRLRVS